MEIEVRDGVGMRAGMKLGETRRQAEDETGEGSSAWERLVGVVEAEMESVA